MYTGAPPSPGALGGPNNERSSPAQGQEQVSVCLLQPPLNVEMTERTRTARGTHVAVRDKVRIAPASSMQT